MTTQTRNEVLLEGIALEAPALSHENHGTRFYRFPLQVPRLSGTPDTLPVLVPEALLTAVRLEDPLRPEAPALSLMVWLFHDRAPSFLWYFQGRKVFSRIPQSAQYTSIKVILPYLSTS